MRYNDDENTNNNIENGGAIGVNNRDKEQESLLTTNKTCHENGYSSIDACVPTTKPKSRLNRTPTQQFALKVLTAAVWISMIGFGLFASMHYVRKAMFSKNWQKSWDLADLHLYRPQHVLANYIMAVHMMFGTILMFLGPIQLIPCMRRNHLNVHRWIGRIYIIAAIMTPGLAVLFTIIYQTSRGDIYEDIGNVIFGTGMITCAIQSYRYVRKGKIEQHKWWSYRLFSIVLGAVLYRLYTTVYFGFILFTPYQGNRWIFELTFFSMVIPNLLIVQGYKTIWTFPMKQQKEKDGIESSNNILYKLRQGIARIAHSAALFWFCTIFVVSTTITISIYAWIPSIFDIDIGQSITIEKLAYPNETATVPS